MKAIQKELGEDEGTVELKELEERIKDAKMPAFLHPLYALLIL